MLMIVSINFNLITIRVQQRPRLEDTTRTNLTSIEFMPSHHSPQQFGTVTQATETTVAVSNVKKYSDVDLTSGSRSLIVTSSAV